MGTPQGKPAEQAWRQFQQQRQHGFTLAAVAACRRQRYR